MKKIHRIVGDREILVRRRADGVVIRLAAHAARQLRLDYRVQHLERVGTRFEQRVERDRAAPAQVVVE
jgi:hypothetical protein